MDKVEPIVAETGAPESDATHTSATAPETVASASTAEDAAAEQAVAPGEQSLADTTGTGTIVALGCIAGTVFIIVLGVIYLVITQLFG